MKKMNFSKLMALVVAILMIASVVPMGAFAADVAPNGTPITSAEEFAAMESNGNYYLANDITVTTTYSAAFTGTFDGNGKTITATCAIFDTVARGTVKNFTVAGATVAHAAGGGIVCNKALGAYFSDITNNVALTTFNGSDMNGLGAIAGVIIGDTTAESTVTIENCVNNGEFIGNNKKTHAGGIVGYCQLRAGEKVNIVIKNCVNNGNIDALKAAGMISYMENVQSTVIIDCENTGNIMCYDLGGGIAGQANTGCGEFKLYNCKNYGDITTTGKFLGGMAAISQIRGDQFEYNGSVLFSNCVNEGNVTAPVEQGGMVAGICGRVYGAMFEYCGNTGNLSTGDAVGGMTGHSENVNIIRYCYNTGDILSTRYAAGIVAVSKNPLDQVYGCYNAGQISMAEQFKGDKAWGIAQVVLATVSSYGTYYDNFYLEGMTFSHALFGVPQNVECNTYLNSTVLSDGTYSFKAEDLASGELTYRINTTVGKNVFFQKLSGEKDTHPVTDSTHKAVVKVGDAFVNLSFVTAETAATQTNGNGLQFTTTVDKADYEALIAAGVNADDVSFGTMITLDKYVVDARTDGNSFSMADFDSIGKAYVNAMGTIVEKDGEYVFAGSIINIPESNLDKTYCAVGYIKIGDDIYYSATYAERSVADVSEAAYADRAEAQSGEYTNAIAANSSVAIGDTASYSPYTEAQLTELKARFEK